MPQVQCARNHFYDSPSGVDSGCPHCAREDAELAKTRAFYQPSPTRPFPGGAASGDPNRTQPFYANLKTELDPVVGWLVCIDGPDKGKDWRLVAGNNTLGRDSAMDVALSNDESISRDRHALVSFEPRQGVFKAHPGDGRGLVYLNGENVVSPVVMKSHDRLEVGKSTLMFVPLSGPHFSWT